MNEFSMRQSRNSYSQILAILKQNSQGISGQKLCEEHDISSAQIHQWWSKFSTLDTSVMKRLIDH